MTTQSTSTQCTYQDYLETSDDVRYELIDGELLVMEPAPATLHQRVVVNLAVLLAPFARDQGLGEVLIAPTDVYLSDTNVLQPDLLFVSAARSSIVTERDVHGAPDLVIEVASPATALRDRNVKMEVYARHGVAECWLVDPAAATIETFRSEDGRMAATGRYSRTDTFATPLLPGLTIDPENGFLRGAMRGFAPDIRTGSHCQPRPGITFSENKSTDRRASSREMSPKANWPTR